jgi:hypothetical protein
MHPSSTPLLPAILITVCALAGCETQQIARCDAACSVAAPGRGVREGSDGGSVPLSAAMMAQKRQSVPAN